MVTKRKVLVVDDNIDFCENIIEILESNGYEAIGVHDGFKALETVENNGIDLVLMDVRMPTMDGVETFKKLKLSVKFSVVIARRVLIIPKVSSVTLWGRQGRWNSRVTYPLLMTKWFTLPST